ncbi:N-acetylmuramoyl-L-alanine amidase family protein [Clostridium chrysemydis]|uniref:N-acetylmuramoyl-L-alanine amidase family protein n=1 Tax=Clostridium chrysemydis TaxID=2665504 RepID=UPI0018838882|nr:N-acetylmuramoyl-L-alanine amidase [Clostridium chrysemydis]
MKKIILLLLLPIFIFVGCSNSKQPTGNKENTTTASVPENPKTESTSEGNKDNEKPPIKKEDSNKKEASNKNEDLNNTEKEKIKEEKVKKQTIVIDPGHSNKSSNSKEPISPDSKEMKLKDTSGSVGVKTKTPEYETTVSVGLKLKDKLEALGYNVILTKDSVSDQMSNIERTDIGNNSNADLLIRLHCDAVDTPKAYGASMLVPEIRGYVNSDISKKSSKYGKKIIDTYTEKTGIYNRGLVTRSDLTGFNWSKVPVVLLELGFISNPKEDLFISDPKNHNEIAESIANGIDKCFN